MNQDFNSFIAVLQHFLEESRVGKPPVTACFAVAGPVAQNKVQFTNRASWSVDGAVISRLLGIEVVRLVNDFVANGYGLLCLDESSECVVLQVCHM
jgi:glucokinase